MACLRGADRLDGAAADLGGGQLQVVLRLGVGGAGRDASEHADLAVGRGQQRRVDLVEQPVVDVGVCAHDSLRMHDSRASWTIRCAAIAS